MSPSTAASEADAGDGVPGGGDGTDDHPRSVRTFLARRFGVDPRALAAFRVALGLLVVGDLLFRGRELTTFYTDAGVLPRSVLAERSPTYGRLSIHALTGSAVGEATLFLLAGAFAVALLSGYRTRLATVAVTVLHASLYARNPVLLNGGDGLLVLGLFLGIFLPLGERWSVDALRAREAGRTPRSWVASMATATLLAQPVVVYLANAGFKLQSDQWVAGTAVQTVLELQHFSVLLGPHLTAYPSLLEAINWLWVAMLVASPLLLVATGWRRALVVAAFVLAHLGMLATMRLGLFPLVVVALLLLYLPSSVWDRLEARLSAGRDLPAAIERRLDGRVNPAGHRRFSPVVYRAGRVATTVFLAVFLVTSVVWPATVVGVVDADDHEAVPQPDGYTWTLFAPNPPSKSRWFVAPATLETGERIDAIDGSAVEWGPPADAADTYPSTLWLRYLSAARGSGEELGAPLAAHLCRRAGGYADGVVTEVAVYAVERRVPSAGGGDVERVELVRRDCTGGP